MAHDVSFAKSQQCLVPSQTHDCLTATLETLVNLRIFLVQPLPPLLWQRVLVSVTGVVSCQNIDGSVQSRKARLSGNLWESPVITHKVNHFLLEIFAKVFHAFGALGEAGGRDHVGTDASSIGFVGVCEAPLRWEFVVFGLFGYGDFCGGHGWEEDSGCGGGGGSLEELTTGTLLVRHGECSGSGCHSGNEEELGSLHDVDIDMK
mmetsp:Transcript_17852/g.38576  ORF Transcript_17852/g.38576 Transcript_17852/m.38576 type:complete len:205 (-) Transcript_17852:54-668(-)